MSDLAIRVDHLSTLYRIGMHSATTRCRDALVSALPRIRGYDVVE
jgi:hypothetical protein